MPTAIHDAVFRDQPEEHSFAVTDVDGTIPPDLHGTLLRW